MKNKMIRFTYDFYLITTMLIIAVLIMPANSIRCYQCSTNTDPKGVDSCGAYKKFNKTQHISVDCNSDESSVPGSFCMKVVQQGPIGFIWDGRWRQVIRRCASVADTGVTGVCNWGVHENGDYWEECYCAEDSCNSGNIMKTSIITILGTLLLAICRPYEWARPLIQFN